jgi:prevent-host-death family protein
MIVNSTDMQNNFGKYIQLAAKEDIIVTKNGRKTAVLKSYKQGNDVCTDAVKENTPMYNSQLPKVTYEEFLKITGESDERYEYIDGEIFLLASPKTAHQRTLMELSNLFYNFFKGKKCVPMIAPYDIKLRRHEKDMNVVQPDLMVICDLDEKLSEDDYYTGVPDLIVEIISLSSRSKDYIKKLGLYMSCGVNEYWIVDTFNREIHAYCFKDRDIEANITYQESDTVSSFIFKEFEFKVNDIFL